MLVIMGGLWMCVCVCACVRVRARVRHVCVSVSARARARVRTCVTRPSIWTTDVSSVARHDVIVSRNVPSVALITSVNVVGYFVPHRLSLFLI